MEERTWQYMFHLIPALVILGLIANIIAVVILLRKRFRGLNITVYLLVLATNNTLFLLVNSWEYQHYIASGPLGVGWPSIRCCAEEGKACVLHLVLRMTAVWISSWITALAMVDRLLYTYLTRHRYYCICTQGTALTVCLLTVLVNFLKKIRFILAVLNPECSFKAVHEMGMEQLCDGTLLPGVVVITCLVLVIFKLPCVDLKHDQPPETAAKARSNFLLTRLVVIFVVLHLLLSVSMQGLSFVIEVNKMYELIDRALYLVALFIIVPAVHHALSPLLFITTARG